MGIGEVKGGRAQTLLQAPPRPDGLLQDPLLVLQRQQGVPALHFAYPNGWFDARTIATVRRAGYRSASTSCRHRDPAHPLLTLPRTILWENSSLGMFGRFSPAVLGCQADGTFDRPGSCPQIHWN